MAIPVIDDTKQTATLVSDSSSELSAIEVEPPHGKSAPTPASASKGKKRSAEGESTPAQQKKAKKPKVNGTEQAVANGSEQKKEKGIYCHQWVFRSFSYHCHAYGC
jgi:hypothetical protein